MESLRADAMGDGRKCRSIADVADHADAADKMPHRLFERRELLGLGRDLSKRHRHCATLARSEVSRLAESTMTPSQNTPAQ